LAERHDLAEEGPGVEALRAARAGDGARAGVDDQRVAVGDAGVALTLVLVGVEGAYEEVAGSLAVGQVRGPLDGGIGGGDPLPQRAHRVVAEEAGARPPLLEQAVRGLVPAGRGRGGAGPLGP